ncbi:antibiotic biosynthesis monooxygenase family protein [Parafrankia discariae]|uniref:antibiotic biosynthesis monooxygenase family protein n=1 Tax=Parafrankia discariae TaxID=365528 RepID=UPI0003728DF4|nr:antibiotic biosynthesis monooxygenase [Parafrankia discariae]
MIRRKKKADAPPETDPPETASAEAVPGESVPAESTAVDSAAVDSARVEGSAEAEAEAEAGAGGRVRVMLWAVDPAEDQGAVERAYHEISSKLVGTPGLLGNRLLRSAAEPTKFAVVSEWTSMAEFVTWERGADHKPATSPLRPLQDPAMRATIFTEVAAYGPDGPFTEPQGI